MANSTRILHTTRALATVTYEQQLLHSGAHPYCNQLIEQIEDERRLRTQNAKKLLEFNLQEVDTLCLASSRAALQQWRVSSLLNRLMPT